MTTIMDPNTLTQLIQPTEISVRQFIIDLLLAGIFSNILAYFYIRYGSSLTNRKRLAKNFFLIAVTTMLVITVVKSSLALSLGLVGALSIVRFRTAVKDPEELAYLFLTISIGLGFGAGQRLITTVALTTIMLLVYAQKYLRHSKNSGGLMVDIVLLANKEDLVSKTTQIIEEHATQVDLRRLQSGTKKTHLGLLVEFSSPADIDLVTKKIQKLDPKAEISVTDVSSIML